VLAALRGLPTSCAPLDAVRTAFSAFGAERRMDWPPTAEQARELIALGPAAVGAFARLRDNKQPVNSAESAHLGAAARLLHAITGEEPDAAKARALDAYFTVCAEHGLNASTFTARVITSTQSDLASAVCGAVGALKGRLHGGAPSEVRDQLTQIGDVEHAEVWIREALAGVAADGVRPPRLQDDGSAPRRCGRWRSGWQPTPTGCSWRSTSRTWRCGCWPSTSPTAR
jgi:citrate synthase